MTGLITRAEDLIQGVAPEWTTVRVVPRGVPRHVDRNLRGIARYAERVGSFLPNLRPDVRVRSTQPIQALSQQIPVDRLVDGMLPGSLVQLDEREIQMVQDVLRDTNTLQTVNLIKSNYDTESTVDLYAEPYVSTGYSIARPKANLSLTQGLTTLSIEAVVGGPGGNLISVEIRIPTLASQALQLSVGPTSLVLSSATDEDALALTTVQQAVDLINDSNLSPVRAAFAGPDATLWAEGPSQLSGGADLNTIGVRGRWPVLLGDQIIIQSDPTLLLSGSHYTVVAVQGHSTSLSLHNTIVVLDQPIPRDLVIDDVVYLRAYPAYRSELVDMPTPRKTSYPIGPVVVDYVSGRFTEGKSPVETLQLQTFDSMGDWIDQPYPVMVPKNHPILRVPIHQSSFLFFNRYRGTITYRNDQFVMRNDDRGRCEIWIDLIPSWPAPLVGTSDLVWSARVRFASPELNSIYYRFWPNIGPTLPGSPNQMIPAASGAQNEAVNVLFGIKAGSMAATRLSLITVGKPNAEVEMDGWQILGQTHNEFWNTEGQQTEQLQYGVTIRQVGAYDHQAGSLMVKPYFSTIADLQTHMDQDRLDSGTLLL